MKRLSLAALTVAGIVTALPAAAQFAKPEDAVKYRKAAFTVMAAHFGRVGAMVNGRAPFDAAAAAENIEIVASSMAKLPFTAFGPGTDTGDTRAKPEHLERQRQVHGRSHQDAGGDGQAEGRGQDRQPRPDQGRLRPGRRRLQGLPRRFPQGVRPPRLHQGPLAASGRRGSCRPPRRLPTIDFVIAILW